ncbi:hypothetical protein LOK49_LG06G03126 [Camellia lanceoleosa]|uniref:Uncharacterized protein n=1 Tax=Camellia lanceoleosa TaxID=1840588 RepID=A0ACC0HGH2_9ERIC|nr:hypothetical protein LOK49_LG06G03126 [Camellia lanceoleosa]
MSRAQGLVDEGERKRRVKEVLMEAISVRGRGRLGNPLLASEHGPRRRLQFLGPQSYEIQDIGADDKDQRRVSVVERGQGRRSEIVLYGTEIKWWSCQRGNIVNRCSFLRRMEAGKVLLWCLRVSIQVGGGCAVINLGGRGGRFQKWLPKVRRMGRDQGCDIRTRFMEQDFGRRSRTYFNQSTGGSFGQRRVGLVPERLKDLVEGTDDGLGMLGDEEVASPSLLQLLAMFHEGMGGGRPLDGDSFGALEPSVSEVLNWVLRRISEVSQLLGISFEGHEAEAMRLFSAVDMSWRNGVSSTEVVRSGAPRQKGEKGVA